MGPRKVLQLNFPTNSWVFIQSFAYITNTKISRQLRLENVWEGKPHSRDITHIYKRPCPTSPTSHCTAGKTFRGFSVYFSSLLLVRLLEAKNLISMSTLWNSCTFSVVICSPRRAPDTENHFSASSARIMKFSSSRQAKELFLSFTLSPGFDERARHWKLCKNENCSYMSFVLCEHCSLAQQFICSSWRKKIDEKQKSKKLLLGATRGNGEGWKHTHREESLRRLGGIFASSGKLNANMKALVLVENINGSENEIEMSGKLSFIYFLSCL